MTYIATTNWDNVTDDVRDKFVAHVSQGLDNQELSDRRDEIEKRAADLYGSLLVPELFFG